MLTTQSRSRPRLRSLHLPLLHALARSVCCAAAWLALHTPVQAQAQLAQTDIDLDVERFAPATSSDGFLGVQATRTPGPGRFALGLHAGLELHPIRLPAGSVAPLRGVDTRTSTWLTGEVGIGGRAALSAVLLAFPYQQLAQAPISGLNNTVLSPDVGLNVSDSRLAARYRLIGESSTKPDAPRDGPGLAFEAVGVVPTSGGSWFAGERALRSELNALADFQLLGAGVGASVGFRHRFGSPALDRYRTNQAGSVLIPDPLVFGDELTFGAAIKAPLPPAPDVLLLLETRGATDFKSALKTSLELDLGARVHVGELAITLGGGFGLTRGLGTPDGRVLLGVLWAPADKDADADGIPDDRDQCPLLAEDHDGFQDSDGCPDPDNDNDLVPDVDDLCPNDPALEGKDDNEDGCTDGMKPTKRGK
ncbi:MAG TPA: thrombospondin type 3 repeat-containing protein [Polyangiales bacterium]